MMCPNGRDVVAEARAGDAISPNCGDVGMDESRRAPWLDRLLSRYGRAKVGAAALAVPLLVHVTIGLDAHGQARLLRADPTPSPPARR